MSRQLQLSTPDGVVEYANNSTVASRTKIWIQFDIDGATLNGFGSLTGVQKTLVAGICNTGRTLSKVVLLAYGGVGTPLFQLIDTTQAAFNVSHSSGLNFGSFTASTIYQCLAVINDAAFVGNSALINVYNPGDFQGTAIASWVANPTLDTSQNVGVVFIGNVDLSGIGVTHTAQQKVYDQVNIGQDFNINDFLSPLEEGSGSAVSPSGTASGAYSWLGTSAAPMRFFRTQTFPVRRR